MLPLVLAIATLATMQGAPPAPQPLVNVSCLVSIENVRGRHVCTGTLIKPDIVLTSARCVDGIKVLNVRAGSKIIGFGGQVVEMEKNCPVAGYDFITGSYDVAILKLKTPFELTDDVIPAQVANFDDLVYDAVVAGWGYNTQGYMQQVPLTQIYQGACIYMYGNDSITPNMMCMTYNEPTSSCLGETVGNPVLVDGKIAAVTITPGACNDNEGIGVYVRVYEDKILPEIHSCF